VPSEGEQRLAAAISDGVAWVAGGTLVWANARFAEMAGRGPLSALIGIGFAELFGDTGSGLPQAGRVVECAIRRPDAAPRSVVCRPAGSPSGGTGIWVVEDVTHLRVLEAELLQTSQALKRANAEAAAQRERLRTEHGERGEFLSVVSHELRTPVTVISGYNRLLLSGQVGPLTEDQERFLQESARACERLHAFIESLIEIGSASGADEVLQLGRGPLEPVIDNVVRLVKPLLDSRELEVAVELGGGAADARFDRMRVERILTNLVGNAIRFAPCGSRIEIGTRLRPGIPTPGGPPRDFVEVSVGDSGPGVAREDRERIFQPYVRGSTGRHSGGLGLGLAICRRLVEAHGGALWVEDRSGGGARFAFTLPASEGAERGA
jgi:two-component system sensor histidine kinase KdpD